MVGEIEVEAKDIDEAIAMAMTAPLDVIDSQYLADSFETTEDEIYEIGEYPC
jgi:hypothetical protein